MDDPEADMGGSLRTASRVPITDKGPTTKKDIAVSTDVTRVRHLLMATPAFDTRVRRLLALIEGTHGPVASEYWSEVRDFAEATDFLFNADEIHRIALDWEHHLEKLSLSVPPALGLTLGRRGRGRDMTEESLQLVARSLEHRLEGQRATKADDAVIGAWSAQSGPAVYRKRIRDRLR